MMTRPFDDETLSRYIDGELDEDTGAEVRDAIACDPDLAERAEAFRRVDSLARAYVSAIDDVPLPAQVRALIDEQTPTKRAGTPGQGPPRRQRLIRGRVPAALAAGTIIALALSIAWRATQPPENQVLTLSEGSLSGQPGLSRMLERSIGGSPVFLDGGKTTARVLATFVSHASEVCREFELAGTRLSRQAVACRTPSGLGNWSIVAVGPVRTAEGQGYVPASGASDDRYSDLVDALIADGPFGRDAEQSLLESDWRELPKQE